MWHPFGRFRVDAVTSMANASSRGMSFWARRIPTASLMTCRVISPSALGRIEASATTERSRSQPEMGTSTNTDRSPFRLPAPGHLARSDITCKLGTMASPPSQISGSRGDWCPAQRGGSASPSRNPQLAAMRLR